MMARIPFGCPMSLSMRSRGTKVEFNEKEVSTELGNLQRSEREDRLTARFGFAQVPEYCTHDKHGDYVRYEQMTDPFADPALSEAPTINEQAWEALVAGSNEAQVRSHVRQSSLSHKRRSLVTIPSKRRSLCEMMCEAASTGDVPQVGRLLGAGADLKRISKEGLLPVHLAAVGGHLGVLKSLAMHGAKMDERDRFGRTALHAAVLGGQATVIPFLVQSGVPVDAKDSDGCTALQLAGEMKTEERCEEFDLESTRNSKVRFSYVFGASQAAKRASVYSTSSMFHTPMESLLRAGATTENAGGEARLWVEASG